jgi:hypothetical protein
MHMSKTNNLTKNKSIKNRVYVDISEGIIHSCHLNIIKEAKKIAETLGIS